MASAVEDRIVLTIDHTRALESSLYAGPLQELLATIQDAGEADVDRGSIDRALERVRDAVEEAVDTHRAFVRDGQRTPPTSDDAIGRLRVNAEYVVDESVSELEVHVLPALARATAAGDPQRVGILREAVDDLRRACERLHPASHGHVGLEHALRGMLRELGLDEGLVTRVDTAGPATQTLIVGTVRAIIATPWKAAALREVAVIRDRDVATLTFESSSAILLAAELAETKLFVGLFGGRASCTDGPPAWITRLHLPAGDGIDHCVSLAAHR